VNLSLAADDAMELGQLLQFLDNWLATDHGPVNESLTRFGRRSQRIQPRASLMPPTRVIQVPSRSTSAPREVCVPSQGSQ
jgi:hypothetical protein